MTMTCRRACRDRRLIPWPVAIAFAEACRANLNLLCRIWRGA